MEVPVTGGSGYALGHSEHELARLSRQGQVFFPFTRQLFEQAGVAAGMRVLDVGSGAGDSSFLVAELVGPTGSVVGVDRSEAAVGWANARALARQIENVNFLLGDPADIEFGEQFDAIVGRFVLMYYPDPVDAIRKLARHLRPTGLMVFQEFDMTNMRSFPACRTFEMATDLIKQAFNASGARTNMGLELNSTFVDAGLPEPFLRMDAVIGAASRFPYELVAGVLQSLLPTIERLRPSTLEIDGLEEDMRREALACKGIAISPGLLGAWSRKPP